MPPRSAAVPWVTLASSFIPLWLGVLGGRTCLRAAPASSGSPEVWRAQDSHGEQLAVSSPVSPYTWGLKQAPFTSLNLSFFCIMKKTTVTFSKLWGNHSYNTYYCAWNTDLYTLVTKSSGEEEWDLRAQSSDVFLERMDMPVSWGKARNWWGGVWAAGVSWPSWPRSQGGMSQPAGGGSGIA